MPDKKYKYVANCSESQARHLINCVNKNNLIRSLYISARKFGNPLISTINLQNASFDYKNQKLAEDKLKKYISSLETLVENSERLKIMPLTKIFIDKKGDIDIKHTKLYGINDIDTEIKESRGLSKYSNNQRYSEEILRIYNRLTDISRLLKGWTACLIFGEVIDNKQGIARVKNLVSNLPNKYSLDSFLIFDNPRKKSGEEFSLEYDAEFSYREGEIEISSEKELPGNYKTFGLKLTKVEEFPLF